MSIPAFLLETKRKTGDVFYQLKSFLWCSVVARCFFILQKAGAYPSQTSESGNHERQQQFVPGGGC